MGKADWLGTMEKGGGGTGALRASAQHAGGVQKALGFLPKPHCQSAIDSSGDLDRAMA